MIVTFKNKTPVIDRTAYIADNATLIGEVSIGKFCSIWFSAILRGDLDFIFVGNYTNIQDGTIIHVADKLPTTVGNYVTIGHGVILHGCTVEDCSLVGSGANILDNVVIGKNSIIAAGAVLAPGTIIPPLSMVMGIPGRVVRTLTEKESLSLKEHALSYVQLMKEYKTIINKPSF